MQVFDDLSDELRLEGLGFYRKTLAVCPQACEWSHKLVEKLHVS